MAIKPSKVRVYLFSLSCQCWSLDPGKPGSWSLLNKWNALMSQLGPTTFKALYSWSSGSEKELFKKFLSIVACFSLFWSISKYSLFKDRWKKDKVFSEKNYLYIKCRETGVGVCCGGAKCGTETSSWPVTRRGTKGRILSQCHCHLSLRSPGPCI